MVEIILFCAKDYMSLKIRQGIRVITRAYVGSVVEMSLIFEDRPRN